LPVSDDDAAARLLRAQRLRAQIDRLKRRGPSDAPDPGAADEAPRDFIERRMQELDEAETKAKTPDDPESELED
jgi:hypothetical protein